MRNPSVAPTCHCGRSKKASGWHSSFQAPRHQQSRLWLAWVFRLLKPTFSQELRNSHRSFTLRVGPEVLVFLSTGGPPHRDLSRDDNLEV